ncbi:MAG: hypothetical protein CML23_11640 [Rhizobiaceae bacterium]|nr:hypothetical protein [Rhizobiaceae bacterium]
MAERRKTIVSTVLLAVAAGCFLVGAGVTVTDVAMRALLGRNVPAAIELTSYSIGLGALLSIPVCYATRTHVSAKLMSELMPGRLSRPLGLLGAAASAVFAALLLWIVAANALSKIGSPETTPDLRLPMPLLLIIVTAALAAAAVAALVGLWLEFKGRGTGE